MPKHQRNNPLSITSLFIQDNLFMVLNLSITRTIDHRVCCYILIKPPYLIHLSYKDKTQKQHNNQNRPRTILMWNEILLNRTFLGRIGDVFQFQVVVLFKHPQSQSYFILPSMFINISSKLT